jgi:hypothetical protein
MVKQTKKERELMNEIKKHLTGKLNKLGEWQQQPDDDNTLVINDMKAGLK